MPTPKATRPLRGTPNLYLYDAGTTQLSFIGTLAQSSMGSPLGYRGQLPRDAYAVRHREDGGDGHVLAFASKAPLTADDTDGGFRDVFRYDAEAETLERVSKAAEGGEDNGPFDASVNPPGV